MKSTDGPLASPGRLTTCNGLETELGMQVPVTKSIEQNLVNLPRETLQGDIPSGLVTGEAIECESIHLNTLVMGADHMNFFMS
jgi:hypothetical protein